jgi:membrane associated rhomboid family serine protease
MAYTHGVSLLRKPFRYRFDNAALALIGLNVLVFLAGAFVNRRIDLYLSMIPALVARGWVWQLVTYMFVHGGISHLFFNMLALLVFGRPVERYMGSAEFLLFYLVTGFLAGVFSFAVYWVTGARGVILMGASGALFAVQLAYASFFPDTVIYLWGVLPLRAPVMVLGFTALELFFAVTGVGGDVAHLTHLAGFAFGWLYFLLRYGINPWRAMRR